MNKIKKNRTAKSLTIGYIRTSNDEQVVVNQKLEILEYCRTRELNIDKWIEVEISTDKSLDRKRIEGLFSTPEGSILVSSEISRLGRSTSETIGLVNQLLRNRVRIIFTKQDFSLDLATESKKVLTLFSMLTSLEKDITSLRVREVLLVRKKQGGSIGKARGTIQHSIYDSKKEQILLLLSKKISVLDISRIIEIGKPRSLLIYLNKRKLREEKKLKSRR